MAKVKFYAKRSDSDKTSKLFSINKGKKDINITFSVDDNGKKDLFTYIVKATSPPVPPNVPPTANFSLIPEAEVGQLVEFDGTGSDSDGTVVGYKWVANGAALIGLDTATTNSFIFPDLPKVDVTLTVTDDKGATGSKTLSVTKKTPLPPPADPCPEGQHRDPATGLCVDDLPSPPTPPSPAGKVLWQSKGIWDNGKSRTLTEHHEYDPYDKLSEVAAGGHGTPRKWLIPGDGNYCFLSGGMSRVYTHVPHQGKIQFDSTFVYNKSLDNFSLEFFSRHNEGGDTSGKPLGWNRFGGVTVSYHKDTVESKIEYYHAVYSKGQSKDLPKVLVEGKAYPIRVIGERKISGDSGEYTLEAFINYGDGLKSLGTFTHKTDTKQAPSIVQQPLYYRFRVNGDAPKDVRISDMSFTQL